MKKRCNFFFLRFPKNTKNYVISEVKVTTKIIISSCAYGTKNMNIVYVLF